MQLIIMILVTFLLDFLHLINPRLLLFDFLHQNNPFIHFQIIIKIPLLIIVILIIFVRLISFELFLFQLVQYFHLHILHVLILVFSVLYFLIHLDLNHLFLLYWKPLKIIQKFVLILINDLYSCSFINNLVIIDLEIHFLIVLFTSLIIHRTVFLHPYEFFLLRHQKQLLFIRTDTHTTRLAILIIFYFIRHIFRSDHL